MIRIQYTANNSGGRWWLEDEDWKALEAAGWKVEWCKDSMTGVFRADEDGRWLGTLAKRASKEVETPDVGLEEWTRITGQDPWDDGCNCCGPPHNFSYEDASGKTHYGEIRRKTSFGGWS